VFNLVAEILVRRVKAFHNTGNQFTCANVFAQVLMYAGDCCLLAVAHSDGFTHGSNRPWPRPCTFGDPRNSFL